MVVFVKNMFIFGNVFVSALHLPTWFPVGIFTYKNYKM